MSETEKQLLALMDRVLTTVTDLVDMSKDMRVEVDAIKFQLEIHRQEISGRE